MNQERRINHENQENQGMQINQDMQINHERQTNQIMQTSQIIQTNQILQTNQIAQSNQILQTKPKMQINQLILMNSKMKMNRSNSSKVVSYCTAGIFLFIYSCLILSLPTKAGLFQVIFVFLSLCVASVFDLMENSIPLFICIGLVLISVIYSVLCTWDYMKWLIGVLVIFLLSIILLINRKAIGFGDILLLGFSIPAVQIENIPIYLFITFLTSSVFGIIKGIITRKVIGTKVPLAPCIAVSFLVSNIL